MTVFVLFSSNWELAPMARASRGPRRVHSRSLPISIPRARTLARIVIAHDVRAVIAQLALAQVKAPPRSLGRRARRRRFCRTAKHEETESVSISGQMAGFRRFWTLSAQWIARWVAFACSTPPPRSPRALVLLHRTVLASATAITKRHAGSCAHPGVFAMDRRSWAIATCFLAHRLREGQGRSIAAIGREA